MEPPKRLTMLNIPQCLPYIYTLMERPPPCYKQKPACRLISEPYYKSDLENQPFSFTVFFLQYFPSLASQTLYQPKRGRKGNSIDTFVHIMPRKSWRTCAVLSHHVPDRSVVVAIALPTADRCRTTSSAEFHQTLSFPSSVGKGSGLRD